VKDYQDVVEQFARVLKTLVELESQADYLEAKLEAMAALPMTNATVHWRKDRNGEPTILELLHATGSEYEQETGRRREYIGKDQEKIAEAKAARKRYKEHQELQRQIREIQSEARSIRYQLDRLELTANAEQTTMWGQENSRPRKNPHEPRGQGSWGQSFEGPERQVSPQSDPDPGVSPQNWGQKPPASSGELSPQDVLDYFQQSPILKGYADDLGKLPAFRSDE